MIAFKPNTPKPAQEGASRPVASAEQWLGRNDSAKRRLWERLNPRHRKQLRLLARALVLHQFHARLPEELRTRLHALLEEFDRLASRAEQLLIAIKQQREQKY
jgi:hypothetical protein